MEQRELVVAGLKCMKNMMRETCRDFLRTTSSASQAQITEIPTNVAPVILPANIGPNVQWAEESSEKSSEELLISPFPGSGHGHGHLPGHHKPGHIQFPFPAPGMRPPRPPHAAPENVQQVFVEMPEMMPEFPNIGQIFPEKWPENLVAAFVPADWLAEHVELNQDDDDEEEEDYEYEDEEDYEYEDEEEDYEYYTEQEDEGSDSSGITVVSGR